MKSILLVVFVWVAVAKADAQPYFNLSYFGLLNTHPGIKLGIQYPLASFGKEQPERLNETIGGVSIVFYFHRRNQIGTGLLAELGIRSRKQDGLNTAFFVGAGYLRTFLPRRVYDFDERSRRFPGNGHFLKTGALGLGWNQAGNLDSPFWMFKPTLLHLKPFGTGSTFNFALDAGYYTRF